MVVFQADIQAAKPVTRAYKYPGDISGHIYSDGGLEPEPGRTVVGFQAFNTAAEAYNRCLKPPR